MPSHRLLTVKLPILESYPDWFRRAASDHPDQICLWVCDDQYTYEQVATWANELASRLVERGVFGRPVAICMPKCLELYLAQLAVMQAGGFFVPIDPAYPSERISHLLEDSQPALILTQAGAGLTLSDSSEIPIESIDLPQLQSATSCPLLNNALTGQDTAYMIYTSGSTGRPKGVPIHHEALLNHNHWAQEAYRLESTDRILQFASISFDISIEEIFPTFLTGATLVSAPAEIIASIGHFLSWVQEQKITVLNLPTAFWHELVQALESQALPDCVRLVIIGGEQVSPSLVEKWFQNTPADLPLINAYGPTETTITSSITVLSPDSPPTIGQPIRGLEYHVLDKELIPVPAGEVGELAISGVGLSQGYWQRPDLTEKSFVDSQGRHLYRTGDQVRCLENQDYEYLGRIDDQVKIRGYRIEPGEIEKRLLEHPSLLKALIRPFQQSGQTYLAAYYLSEGSTSLSEQELAQFLQDRLPAYMIPTRFIALSSIPVTSGGKIDFKALPNPQENLSEGSGSEPSSDTEKNIAKIWSEILNQSTPSIDADFFQIGGNSLIALRLVCALEKAFPHLKLPVSTLIDHSTIRSLATLVDQAPHQEKAPFQGEPLITVLNPDEPAIPIIAIHGAGGAGLFFREFAEALPRRHPFYILESGLLTAGSQAELPQQTLEEISQLYLEAILSKLKHSSIILTGYSTGGLIAYEVARRATKYGITVKALINLDAPNPQVIVPAPKSLFLKRIVLTAFRDSREFIDRLRMNWYHFIESRNSRQGIDELSVLTEHIRPVYEKIESRFRPQEYSEGMILIASKGGELSSIVPDDMGWNAHLGGPLKIHEVPGTHLTMLEKQNLPHTVGKFREILMQTLEDEAPSLQSSS